MMPRLRNRKSCKVDLGDPDDDGGGDEAAASSSGARQLRDSGGRSLGGADRRGVVARAISTNETRPGHGNARGKILNGATSRGRGSRGRGSRGRGSRSRGWSRGRGWRGRGSRGSGSAMFPGVKTPLPADGERKSPSAATSSGPESKIAPKTEQIPCLNDRQAGSLGKRTSGRLPPYEFDRRAYDATTTYDVAYTDGSQTGARRQAVGSLGCAAREAYFSEQLNAWITPFYSKSRSATSPSPSATAPARSSPPRLAAAKRSTAHASSLTQQLSVVTSFPAPMLVPSQPVPVQSYIAHAPLMQVAAPFAVQLNNSSLRYPFVFAEDAHRRSTAAARYGNSTVEPRAAPQPKLLQPKPCRVALPPAFPLQPAPRHPGLYQIPSYPTVSGHFVHLLPAGQQLPAPHDPHSSAAAATKPFNGALVGEDSAYHSSVGFARDPADATAASASATGTNLVHGTSLFEQKTSGAATQLASRPMHQTPATKAVPFILAERTPLLATSVYRHVSATASKANVKGCRPAKNGARCTKVDQSGSTTTGSRPAPRILPKQAAATVASHCNGASGARPKRKIEETIVIDDDTSEDEDGDEPVARNSAPDVATALHPHDFNRCSRNVYDASATAAHPKYVHRFTESSLPSHSELRRRVVSAEERVLAKPLYDVGLGAGTSRITWDDVMHRDRLQPARPQAMEVRVDRTNLGDQLRTPANVVAFRDIVPKQSGTLLEVNANRRGDELRYDKRPTCGQLPVDIESVGPRRSPLVANENGSADVVPSTASQPPYAGDGRLGLAAQPSCNGALKNATRSSHFSVDQIPLGKPRPTTRVCPTSMPEETTGSTNKRSAMLDVAAQERRRIAEKKRLEEIENLPSNVWVSSSRIDPSSSVARAALAQTEQFLSEELERKQRQTEETVVMNLFDCYGSSRKHRRRLLNALQRCDEKRTTLPATAIRYTTSLPIREKLGQRLRVTYVKRGGPDGFFNVESRDGLCAIARNVAEESTDNDTVAQKVRATKRKVK